MTERKGDRSGAERKYLEILAEAERLREADIRMVCMQALGTLSEANGDTVRAHRLTVAQYAIQDSLFNIRRFATITDIAREHDKGRMQRDFNLMAGQKRLQTVILVILACALAVIGLFLLWMWHKKRQLFQSNRELYNKYQELLELKLNSDKELTAESESHRSDNSYKNKLNKDLPDKHAEETSRQSGGCIDDSHIRRLYTDIVAVMNSDAIFEQSFSADTLAAITGSKTRYVSEAISKGYGKNFSTMLAEYRIREAGRRMSDPEKSEKLTFEAIAAEVGFKNRSTFSVTFKKITGLTPREYQKIARAETETDS